MIAYIIGSGLFCEERCIIMSMNPIDYSSVNNLNIPHRGKYRDSKTEREGEKSLPAEASDSVTINQTGENRKSFPSDSLKEIKKYDEPLKENGLVDSSSKSSDGTTTITLISTNDLHGHFRNLPKVAGLIEQLRTENPDALVLDIGDISYNPPYSDANHFDPVIDIMNQIGYNIVEPGNHEFQYGAPVMHDEYTSRINADVVCANIRDRNTDDYLEGTKPYVIKDMNGVKVAFIGTVTTKMATSAHPSVGSDVKKLDINDTVEKLIPEVKAQGAEVIVNLNHNGIGKNSSLNLAQNVEGIDVIMAGHDHQLTEGPITVSKFPNKTYIIEGMSHGKFVVKTDIVVDNKTHDVIAVNMRPYPTSSNTVKADQAVEDIIQNYQEKSGGEVQHGGGNIHHNNHKNNHHGHGKKRH